MKFEKSFSRPGEVMENYIEKCQKTSMNAPKWKEESLGFNLIGNIHVKKIFLIIQKLNYIPEMPTFSSCHMALFGGCE